MNSRFSRAATTLQRKLDKSIQQRGVVGTLRRSVVMPFQYVRSFWRSKHNSIRELRLKDLEWDRVHNVDTCPDKDAGWMSEIASDNWVHGRGYHPAPTDSLYDVLADLGIDFSQFVFIDLGSGKGRSLLVASDFPFREIVGVEYSRRLHEIAVRNFATYQSPTQRGLNLTAVHRDAAEYELPDAPLVIYFYDPFGESVMKPVVDHIHESLQAKPREIFIVYFNPVFAEMFEARGCFERLAQGSEFERYWKKSEVNRDANEFESEELDAYRFVVYRSLINESHQVALCDAGESLDRG